MNKSDKKLGDVLKHVVTIEILNNKEKMYNMPNLMACLGKLIIIGVLNPDYAHNFPYRELVYDVGSRKEQGFELSSIVMEGVRKFDKNVNQFHDIIQYLNDYDVDEWLYCYLPLLSELKEENVIEKSLYIKRKNEGFGIDQTYKNSFYKLDLVKLIEKYNMNNGVITLEDVHSLLELIEKEAKKIVLVKKDDNNIFFKIIRGSSKEILIYDAIKSELVETGLIYITHYNVRENIKLFKCIEKVEDEYLDIVFNPVTEKIGLMFDLNNIDYNSQVLQNYNMNESKYFNDNDYCEVHIMYYSILKRLYKYCNNLMEIDELYKKPVFFLKNILNIINKIAELEEYTLEIQSSGATLDNWVNKEVPHLVFSKEKQEYLDAYGNAQNMIQEINNMMEDDGGC